MLLVSDSYHRTRELSLAYLSRWGIETTLVAVDRPDEWASALRPETRLIFAETPTNPYLRVMDLERLAALPLPMGFPTGARAARSTSRGKCLGKNSHAD